MGETKDWFEDVAFWEITRPFMFAPERWDVAASSIEKLRSLLNIDPPAAVLDLCCGPGRFALPLAQHGFRVTAVDRTVPLLDELRTHASGASLAIDIVQSDMRAFCRPNTFDAAINMFTSFGYFDDPDDDLTVLRNLHASLKPGGRLLIDTIHREWLLREFQARDWMESGGLLVLDERELIDSFTRIHNRWIIIRGSERYEWEFNLRLYGAADLGDLLREAGFSEVHAFGTLDGAPCDLKASRLVIVATK